MMVLLYVLLKGMKVKNGIFLVEQIGTITLLLEQIVAAIFLTNTIGLLGEEALSLEISIIIIEEAVLIRILIGQARLL